MNKQVFLKAGKLLQLSGCCFHVGSEDFGIEKNLGRSVADWGQTMVVELNAFSLGSSY